MGTNAVYVLCYHRILQGDGAPEERPYFARGTAVSQDVFRRHLQDIRSRFECLSQDRVLAVIRGEEDLTRPGCWITFDDAYVDVWERAVPLLNEAGLPATVFVSTAVLDLVSLPADRWYATLITASRRRGVLPGDHQLPYDLDDSESYRHLIDGSEKRQFLRSCAAEQERLLRVLAECLEAETTTPRKPLYLNRTQLRSLRHWGWDVGSHSVTHPILVGLNEAAVRHELVQSRVTLEQTVGVIPRCFAYPDGAWDQTVVQGVREAGYDAAVILDNRAALPRSDIMVIPRVLALNAEDWVESLSIGVGQCDPWSGRMDPRPSHVRHTSVT